MGVLVFPEECGCTGNTKCPALNGLCTESGFEPLVMWQAKKPKAPKAEGEKAAAKPKTPKAKAAPKAKTAVKTKVTKPKVVHPLSCHNLHHACTSGALYGMRTAAASGAGKIALVGCTDACITEGKRLSGWRMLIERGCLCMQTTKPKAAKPAAAKKAATPKKAAAPKKAAEPKPKKAPAAKKVRLTHAWACSCC